MTDVETLLKECRDLRDDPNKAAKTRRVATKTIEVCLGVIGLKEENANLAIRIKELEKRLGPAGRVTATDILNASK